MNKYIRIMRIDHWIKQLFVIPGVVCALLLTRKDFEFCISKVLLGLFIVCLIASANYSINEWLDAEFDKYHPTKCNRTVVTEDIKGSIVLIIWFVCAGCGLLLGYWINIPFFSMCLLLLIMGIVYNVRPFRTKDLPYIDVISESVNNAIRFLLGWFIISASTIPPSSAIFGYWMAGAFLMATKRFAEYRMISNKDVAGMYRKSFRFYSERLLLISSFFYAMVSVFCVGVFLIKYRIEYILAIPLIIGLFCYYLFLAFEEDSAVQKPEKLYREKRLLLLVGLITCALIVLTFVDMPFLEIVVSDEVIHL